MARYRIVRRRDRLDPSLYVYDVEERQLPFWWERISSDWSSIEMAEEFAMSIKRPKTTFWNPEVIKECD